MVGFIVVDKPAGMTSQQVVSRVKRLLGCRKAGHTGTLDPLATGVLPVAVGRATRAIPFLDEAVKVYQGELHLGLESTTYDREGAITHRFEGDVSFSRERLEAVFGEFTGTISQVPPVYSAIKHQGQPLYALARQGREVVPPVREVIIEKFVLTGMNLPRVAFEVACSRGTYVRSLVFDVGRRLGCGALLTELRRCRSGPFTLEQAVTLEDLAREAAAGRQSYLLPMARVLAEMPTAVIADDGQREKVRAGAPLPLWPSFPGGNFGSGTLFKVVDAGGVLLAIASLDGENGRRRLRMKRVFL